MKTIALVLFGLFSEIDLDRYLPPPPPPVPCASDMLDYPVRLLPFGRTQTLFFEDEAGRELNVDIPPGYLVSECELVRLTNLKLEAKRLRRELSALQTLRTKEFALWRVLENQYTQQVASLSTQSWYERNRLAIGVAIGVVTTSLIVWTSAQLVR